MAQEFLQAFALVGIVLFLFGSLVFIVAKAILKFRKQNKTHKIKYYKRNYRIDKKN